MKVRPLAYASAVLVLGVGALFASKRAEHEDARHALPAAAAALPQLALSAREAANLTRIELLTPDGDASERRIVLEKRAQSWQLISPLNAPASVPKVAALIENLSALRVTDAIDPTRTHDEPYGLSADRAFHVRAYLGPKLLRDLYFGKSSARGQLLCVGGEPGVFSIDSSGPGSYAGYLYTRPLRSWREPAIFDFDEREVSEVHIDNPHGAFSFQRRPGGWAGSRRLRSAKGELGAVVSSWEKFDSKRVAELLEALSKLSADEFGEEKDRASSGVEEAELTGGVITIAFQGSARASLRVGRLASGPSTWAIKDSRWAVKSGADSTLYALALWTTDWITSDSGRFEK